MGAGWIAQGPDTAAPAADKEQAAAPTDAWTPVSPDTPAVPGLIKPAAAKTPAAAPSLYQRGKELLFGHEPQAGDADQHYTTGILPSLGESLSDDASAANELSKRFSAPGAPTSAYVKAYPHVLAAQVEKLQAGVQEATGASQVQSAEQELAAYHVLPAIAPRFTKNGFTDFDAMAKDPLVRQQAIQLGMDPRVFAGQWASMSGLSNEQQADNAARAQAALDNGRKNVVAGSGKRAQAWADERVWRPTDPEHGQVDPWNWKSIAFDTAVGLPDLALTAAATVGTTAATGNPALGVAAGGATAVALFAPGQRADIKDKIDDKIIQLQEAARESDRYAPPGSQRALNPVATDLRQQAADLAANSDKIANTAGFLYGVSDAIGAVPVSSVLSRVPGGKQVLDRMLGAAISKTAGGRVGGAMIANGAGMMLQTTLQKAVDAGIIHEQTSLPDALSDIARSGVIGALTAAPIGVAHEVATAPARARAEAAQRDLDADALRSRVEAAMASPTAGRPADEVYPGYRWNDTTGKYEPTGTAPAPGQRRLTGTIGPESETKPAPGETKGGPGATEAPQSATNAQNGETGAGAARAAWQAKVDALSKVAAQAEKRSDVSLQPEEQGWSVHVKGEPVAQFDTVEAAREAMAQARKVVGTAPKPPPGQEERRTDTATRQKVDEMTHEQLKAAFLTHELTGIPNKRAYEDSTKKPAQTSIDVDSLKWINDAAGHAAGDELLKQVAKALHEESGGNAYHISGDEFVLQGKTPAEAQAAAERAAQRLSKVRLEFTHPDGSVITLGGIGLSHGTASTLAEADARLAAHKAEREAAGTRAARGEKPSSASVVAPEPGLQADQGGSAPAQGKQQTAEVLGQTVRKPEVPSPAQAKEGNYFKPTVEWHGLPIKVENLTGSRRSYVDASTGKTGQRKMRADYGYFPGTKGGDHEGVDVMMGPHKNTDKAFVIDQLDHTGTRFDEHKVQLGVRTEAEARAQYLAHYPKGWKGLGAITELDHEQLARWLKEGDLRAPLSPHAVPVEKVVRGAHPDNRHDSILEYLARHPRGLDSEEAQAQGIDREDMHLPAAKVGIKRAFRKGGMTFDEAAEHLHEAGYPVTDEKGHYNANTLLDRIDDELAGRKHLSIHNTSYTPEAADIDWRRKLSTEELHALTAHKARVRLEGIREAHAKIVTEMERLAKLAGGEMPKEPPAPREREPGEDDEIPFQRTDKYRENSPERQAVVDELTALRKAAQAETGAHVDLNLYRSGDLELDMLRVPKEKRSQGIGSNIVERATAIADKHGLRMVLSPGHKGEIEGTTSHGRLVTFYKRFGFVENKGRNKDFTVSASMYRLPKVDRGYEEPAVGETPGVREQQDLFGDKVNAANQIKRLEAELDRKRNSGQLSVETGNPGDLFSQAQHQVDLVDEVNRPPAELELMDWRKAGHGILRLQSAIRSVANLSHKAEGYDWDNRKTRAAVDRLIERIPEVKGASEQSRFDSFAKMLQGEFRSTLDRARGLDMPVDLARSSWAEHREAMKGVTDPATVFKAINAIAEARLQVAAELEHRANFEEIEPLELQQYSVPEIEQYRADARRAGNQDAVKLADELLRREFREREESAERSNREHPVLIDHPYFRAHVDMLQQRLERFASGMSRPKDITAAGAGTSGTGTLGFGVDVGELSKNGIAALAREVVERGAHVFVDSGAFSLFRKGLKAEGKVEPMDFDKVLDKYDEILNEVHERDEAEEHKGRLYLVMPDIVGDQKASLGLVKEYKHWIQPMLRGRVARPIIPIQKGELSLTEAFRAVAKELGTSDFIVGIPANEAAVSVDELTQFATQAKPGAIHFLGAVGDKNLRPKLEALTAGGTAPYHLSADGNLLRSTLYGKQEPGTPRSEAVAGTLLKKAEEYGSPEAAQARRDAKELAERKAARERNAKLPGTKAEKLQALQDELTQVEAERQKQYHLFTRTARGKPVAREVMTRLHELEAQIAVLKGEDTSALALEAPPAPPKLPTTDVGEELTRYEVEERKGSPSPDQLDIFANAKAPEPVNHAVQAVQSVKLRKAGTFHAGVTKVSKWQDAAHIVAPLRKQAQENVVALVLNKAGRPLAVIRHSIGMVDAANVEPWSLAGSVLQVPGAASVYFAHNHPSGEVFQSNSDEFITHRLTRMMDGTGVKPLGMIVVGSSSSKASYFHPPVGEHGDVEFPIPTHARTRAVPVLERRFAASRKAADKGRNLEAIKGIAAGRYTVLRLQADGIESGIVMLNQRHKRLGVIPMSEAEMLKLKTGSPSSGAGRILTALTEANSHRLIVFGPQEAARNVVAFGNAIGVHTLDMFVPQGPAGQLESAAEAGILTSDDQYMQRGFVPPAGWEEAVGQRPRSMAPDEIRGYVDKFLSGFKTKPEVVIAKDLEELQGMEDFGFHLAGYDPGDIVAFVQPSTKRIFLVATEFHEPEDVAATLAHEYVTHFGLREAFDDKAASKEYQAILDGVTEAMPAEVRRRGQREYGDSYNHFDPTQRARAAEEALAYYGQRYSRDQSVPGKIRRLLDRWLGMIRDWVRKALGLPKKFDELFVRRTLADLETFLRRGGAGLRDATREGAASANQAGPAAARHEDTFFSGLAKAVDAAKRDKGTGAEWERTLRNMPGVKAEEMQWTGLKDWLEGQGRVSKAQVAEYVNAHQIQLGEVMHGKGKQRGLTDEEVQELNYRLGDKQIAQMEGDQVEALQAGGSDTEHMLDELKRMGIDTQDMRQDRVEEWEEIVKRIEQLGYTVEENPMDGSPMLEEVPRDYGDEDDLDKLAQLEAFHEEQYQEAKALLRRLEQGNDSPPQYQQFTEGGGKNYREMLITLAPAGEAARILANRKAVFERYHDQLAELDRRVLEAAHDSSLTKEQRRGLEVEREMLEIERDEEANRHGWIDPEERRTSARQRLNAAKTQYRAATKALFEAWGPNESEASNLYHFLTEAADPTSELYERSKASLERFVVPSGAFPDGGRELLNEALTASAALNRAHVELAAAARDPGAIQFRTGHWKEPNVLAHVRFDDRTGPNGERVLHIAETQSDWHQQGRKKGYQTANYRQAKQAFDEYGQKLAAKYGLNPEQNLAMFHRLKNMDDAEVNEYERLQRNANLGGDPRAIEIDAEMDRLAADRDPVTGGMREERRWMELARERDAIVGEPKERLPDAPFKTTWPDLVMKRMLRYAAERGYDALSWDTGQTNAERYDLSRHISQLELTDNSSGGIGKAELEGPFDHGNLVAHAPDGTVSMDRHIYSQEELERTIGKELSDRLLASQPTHGNRAGIGVRRRQLSGLDIKTGGEGMQAFYDRQLPLVMGKLIKKWGGYVEPGQIETTSGLNPHVYTGPDYGVVELEDFLKNEPDLSSNVKASIQDVIGVMSHNVASFREAMESSGTPAAAYALGGMLKPKRTAVDTHMVRITPAMRDSVMQGQPMFLKRRKGSSGAAAGPGRAKGAYMLARRAIAAIPESEFVMSLRRIADPSTVSEPARATALVTREALGGLAQSSEEALTNLERFSKLFDQLGTQDRYAFIDAMEDGKAQPIGELQPAADAIRSLLDDWRERIRGLGVGALDNFIENYFPHIWARDDKARRVFAQIFGRRPLKGPASFLKERTIPTTREGLEAGLTPISTNPLVLAFAKLREMQRFYTGVKLMQRFKDEGLARFLPSGRQRPDDWAEIEDAVGRVRQWSEVEQGFVERGHYIMPVDAARVINNHLGASALRNFLPAQVFRSLSNAANALQLGFSAFHLGFTTLDAVISKNALAIERLAHGEPLKAAQALLEASTGIGGAIMNIRRGSALLKAYSNISGATPEMRRIVEGLMAGGGRIKMDNYYMAARGLSPFKGTGFATLAHDIKTALTKPQGKVRELTQVMGGFPQQYATRLWRDLQEIWELEPFKILPIMTGLEVAGRATRASTSIIMEHIVPLQKLGVFSDLAADHIRRNPLEDPVAFASAMQKIWNSVDNRLGEMVYDNVFWNRTFKEVNHMMVRAVGWNLGTVRELGGAPIDVVKVLDYLARGAPAEPAHGPLSKTSQARLDYEQQKSILQRVAEKVGHKIPYTLALIGTTMVLGAVLTRLFTGKDPEEIKDYFFPPTGRLTKYGTKERISMPSYTKDLYEYGTQPATTVINKANPIFGIAHSIYANEDFFGNAIRNTDESPAEQTWQSIIYGAKAVLPFSVQGTRQFVGAGEMDERGKILSTMPYVGFGPAPARVTSPEQMDAYQHEEDEKRYIKGLRMRLKQARDKDDKQAIGELTDELHRAQLKERETEAKIRQNKIKAAEAQRKITSAISGKSRADAVAALHQAGLPAFARLWESLPERPRDRVAESLEAFA